MHHAIQSYTLITFVVVGLSHLLRPRDWADTYARLHRLGPTGAFINGGLSLLPGAALVAAHPVYAGPAIIVTLLGWALVLKGSVCLVAPSVALRGMDAVGVYANGALIGDFASLKMVRADLAPDLPRVNLDPDQFKRVVVNLVDNAAEAMRDAMVKRLMVVTRATSADSVELLVADTGCGISAGDKEKLFLPYFSTKGRGTGLGLAIVSHILTEHGGRIRVEDNRPAGTRFYVEVPVGTLDAIPAEAEVRA